MSYNRWSTGGPRISYTSRSRPIPINREVSWASYILQYYIVLAWDVAFFLYDSCFSLQTDAIHSTGLWRHVAGVCRGCCPPECNSLSFVYPIYHEFTNDAHPKAVKV